MSVSPAEVSLQAELNEEPSLNDALIPSVSPPVAGPLTSTLAPRNLRELLKLAAEQLPGFLDDVACLRPASTVSTQHNYTPATLVLLFQLIRPSQPVRTTMTRILTLLQTLRAQVRMMAVLFLR